MRSANPVFCLTKGNSQKTTRRQRGHWESPGGRVLVAAGDTGLGSGQSTLPSREMSLTSAGRWQLLAKSSCWLSSQSWTASIGFPQRSSGLSKGWMDGQGWPHGTGVSWLLRWPCLGGHSLPSPEWKCLQKELAVGDVISPVGFHVTAVNSVNAP